MSHGLSSCMDRHHHRRKHHRLATHHQVLTTRRFRIGRYEDTLTRAGSVVDCAMLWYHWGVLLRPDWSTRLWRSLAFSVTLFRMTSFRRATQSETTSSHLSVLSHGRQQYRLHFFPSTNDSTKFDAKSAIKKCYLFWSSKEKSPSSS